MFFKRIINHRVRSIVLLFLLTILYSYTASATIANTDSTRFSLLTCAPGDEIYSLFGHTAIRYEDPGKGIDVVFNYGVFSFNTPNFIYRFVKGETDYMLGVVDFPRFEAEYAYHNRAVWQQNLNLNAKEKEVLLELLYTNYQPENRIYRYNFFYDNCATRPRDKIEESISGKIVYQSVDPWQSFRDIIYQSSKGHEWDRFGMDLCLGVEADRPISYREEMFAPLYLMDAFKHAVIAGENNTKRPLVSGVSEVVSEQDIEKEKPFPLTPMRSMLLLFILIASATIYGIRKKKSLWGIDLILFAAAGLAGCVLAFLSCFSEHPAVGTNYLIFVFHPLHILLLPLFLRKEAKGRKSYYHLINTIVLTLFILIWPVNPQHFNLAILPLALCLLVRSVSNLVLTYKKDK
ncbi:DUF4105 domain-containing protein [Bacteroides sp. 51]|uniref:lipoprotein N-acyltransferase Lnb n=1 Tax=Bacteroides sp. 51 TaxID=2302938 RepID=UPI0013CF6097|nr:DUF4105 domain-containing protein [Bacteroides sp. 51]NDV82395.1 DUF4105 domain-containing protein [Bacteroides sp. 51]